MKELDDVINNWSDLHFLNEFNEYTNFPTVIKYGIILNDH